MPNEGGLSLVSDTYSCYVVCRETSHEHVTCYALLAAPYLFRVMFHPAGPGVYLRELTAPLPDYPPCSVEKYGTGTGRALVESQDVLFGNVSTLHLYTRSTFRVVPTPTSAPIFAFAPRCGRE